MALRLLPYHVRLAGKSLRRDPGLSATIVIVMTVVAGIFCTALMHYLRLYGPAPASAPGLHHVEVGNLSGPLQTAFEGTMAEPSAVAARLRVSYPVYRLLSASHIPSRETATFRTRLLVRRPDLEAGARRPGGAPPVEALDGPEAFEWARPHNARFVNADFFSLFGVALSDGAPFTRQQEATGAAVVVISKRLAEALFPERGAVGATLQVNGSPYRVVGVCAEDQPMKPEWDRAVAGGSQDVLYLPFAEHLRLRATPEMPVQPSFGGPRYVDQLGANEIFVSYWAELPTRELRQAYETYLHGTFDARQVAFRLRDLGELRAAFALPKTSISFFLFLGFVILLGGGLIMTRLLLAKGLARGDELGIFRALGAPRRSLFARQLIEAGILAGVAGVLSLVIAGPQALFYNRAIADTDIPLVVTPAAFGITAGLTLGVGLLFALYPAWRASTGGPTVSMGRR
jgi:putative ABC transport system permease protein